MAANPTQCMKHHRLIAINLGLLRPKTKTKLEQLSADIFSFALAQRPTPRAGIPIVEAMVVARKAAYCALHQLNKQRAAKLAA
jgi:hypothetical protein